MKLATKSSITLPPEEHDAVLRLRQRTGAASNVEIVRRALRLLEAQTERDLLRQAYADASLRVRDLTLAELADLDGVAGDGLEP